MKKSHQMYLLLVILLCCIGNTSYAQKRPLDITETAGNWVSVRNPVITNDGNYYAYTINNQPLRSETLIIKAANSTWQHELPGIGDVSFTDDSRKAIFMKGDSLSLLNLGTGSTEYIPGVAYFQLFKQGESEWLAIQKNSANQELLLRNLVSGRQTSYEGVSQFLLSPTRNTALLIKQTKRDSATETSLHWLSLPEHKLAPVFQSMDQLGSFTFDNQGKQLAFVSSKTIGTYDDVSFSRGMPDDIIKSQISSKPLNINSIMYYAPALSSARLWVDDKTPGIDPGLKVGDGSVNFSKDGARLFFRLSKIPVSLKMPENPVMVEVWSYKDAYLHSEQQMPGIFGWSKPGLNNDYVAVINKGSSRITRLQQAKDDDYHSNADEHIIVETYKDSSYNRLETYRLGEPTTYLVSAINGSRKVLPRRSYLLSPSSSGKYLLYLDTAKKHLFSYEIKTGITKNITEHILVPIWFYTDEGPGSNIHPFHGTTWLDNDASVLIYDQYDIWQVDPSGVKPPVCVTNGYGRKHGITLRILDTFGASGKTGGLTANSDLLLFAFNESNKDRGYFRKKMGTGSDPEMLLMGAYNYSGGVHSGTSLPSGMPELIKAKNADVFILFRESEIEAPNLFLTKDFKQLRRITDIQPHKDINWLTTELVTWKKFDGNTSQGILYKPENFDPNKKYPLIIWYYQENSAALHSFLAPATSRAVVNIPNFVSNGYLVFVPDITYKIGAPGESAYNSVVSAAEYLSKLPYINAKKMAITGHSFGGYQTNYILTRTPMFAAALSASGPTNFISAAPAIHPNGADKFDFHESGQPRMGATIWENQQAYISSSPIFRADKITTPLLLMHNKLDGAVVWQQAVEFFTSLRRLNKQVWLLQYDNENHFISNPNNQKDYTIRMKQFFDHYLKDMPAPVWMSRGIPAKMKGIESGLSLDTTGVTQGPVIDTR